jgi:hypothetical protein
MSRNLIMQRPKKVDEIDRSDIQTDRYVGLLALLKSHLN